jgi:hypothetical protein
MVAAQAPHVEARRAVAPPRCGGCTRDAAALPLVGRGGSARQRDLDFRCGVPTHGSGSRFNSHPGRHVLRPPSYLATAVLVMTASAACASGPQPDLAAEQALLHDVRTLVRSHARDAWTVDRISQEAIAPGVAVSACQAGPEARRGLIAWLDARITVESGRIGGSAAEVWRREGSLDAVEDLLELQRVRAAVAGLDARADADCPFWLAADPDFIGIEGDADRGVLWLESRGGGSINLRGRDVALSGGGAGRLLVGYGFGRDVTLAGGLELGGAGRFARTRDEAGRMVSEISGVLGAAVPVVLRLADAGEVIDLEVAATAFLDGKPMAPPGVRAAVAWGLVTPRVGGAFSPMALFWVGWEYHPRRGDEAPFHMIGVGTRVGVDIDP